jgi:GTPase Era involved in 16S rRNA processing
MAEKIDSEPEVSNDRYAVVLGKSGAGKSTTANKLLGLTAVHDDLFKVKASVEGVTEKVMQMTTHLYYNGDSESDPKSDSEESVPYKLTLIDTVGLFDAKKTNKVIIEQVKTHLREKTKHLNVALFVMKQGRFTKEEKDVFRLIRKYCKDSIASEMSALVITACEHMTDAQREKLKEEFETNKETKKIAKFMKRGIYLVGFPDTESLNQHLKQHYEDLMQKEVETLRNVIYNAPPRCVDKSVFSDKWWHKCPIL